MGSRTNPDLLTSRANPQFKRLIGLQKKKNRQAAGVIWVEGVREVLRAATSGWVVEEVVAVGETKLPPQLQSLPVLRLDEPLWNSLVYRESTESVAALVRLPPPAPLDFNLPILVLDSVEKPGNVGAVLRSADGAGIRQVVLCGEGCDIGNTNLIRASVGTLFSINPRMAAADVLIAAAKTAALPIVVADPAGIACWPPRLPRPCMVVLGSEHAGVPDIWLTAADARVAIPMRGLADSLNVAQTATLLAYCMIDS